MLLQAHTGPVVVLIAFFVGGWFATAGLPLLGSRRWRKNERNILIGAAVVLSNALVIAAVIAFVLFGGDRFGSLVVSNRSGAAVAVQFNSSWSSSVPAVVPADENQSFYQSTLDDLTVTLDSDPPREFRLAFERSLWARDVTVEIAQAPPSGDAAP
jgi:hypothetical protein